MTSKSSQSLLLARYLLNISMACGLLTSGPLRDGVFRSLVSTDSLRQHYIPVADYWKESQVYRPSGRYWKREDKEGKGGVILRRVMMLDDGGRVPLLQFALVDLNQYTCRCLVQVAGLHVSGHQQRATGGGLHVQGTHAQSV